MCLCWIQMPGIRRLDIVHWFAHGFYSNRICISWRVLFNYAYDNLFVFLSFRAYFWWRVPSGGKNQTQTNDIFSCRIAKKPFRSQRREVDRIIRTACSNPPQIDKMRGRRSSYQRRSETILSIFDRRLSCSFVLPNDVIGRVGGRRARVGDGDTCTENLLKIRTETFLLRWRNDVNKSSTGKDIIFRLRITTTEN